MNEKCLILGAGFSKAVAKLPIMNNMLTSFKDVIEEQKKLNNRNRVKWGERILLFLEKLENEFLRIPYSKAEKGGKILESNYLENFEALCSFIDLNLAFEINARCEINGIKADLSGKPMFVNFSSPELKEIRGYIGNYIYLTFINDKSDDNLLNAFYEKLLLDTPTIITFNYDLVLDKFLFKKGDWLPIDGYGFLAENIPKLNPLYDNQKSKIKLLKMHGSLNWKVDPLYYNTLELEWCDDMSNYFFPTYLNEEKKRGFTYKGGFAIKSWLLPSWIKQFTYSEIIQVWNQAALKLRDAKEIVFIGYSLPRADSAVYSLFSGIDFASKKITIIDPKANELKKHFSLLFPKNNIEVIPTYLESHLLN